MRQVLGPGALGRPRGIGWRGRREGGSGWGIHVNPWLIHVNAWRKPLQYFKVISLQLIKINGEKKEKKRKEMGIMHFLAQDSIMILSSKMLGDFERELFTSGPIRENHNS